MDLSVIKGYSHIIPFEKQCDVNTILPYTNCLITDYSSVYSDFILLGKEIIIFPFDLEDSYNKATMSSLQSLFKTFKIDSALFQKITTVITPSRHIDIHLFKPFD